MKKQLVLGAILLVILMVGGGCSPAPAIPAAAAGATPTAIAPGVKGKLVPNQFVELSLASSGTVSQVLVAEGQTITPGQPLLQLDSTRLQLAVEEAHLQLRNAEIDLEKANKPADPADLAAAEQAVQAARVALANAQAGKPTLLDQSQSALRTAELDLENAQRAHDKLLEYKNQGFDVQDALKSSQVRLDNLKAQLEIARRDASGANSRAGQPIVQAQETLAQAEARYQALKKQPEAETVQTKQLAVDKAHVALARAQANLQNATLVAPIAGAVAEVKVKPGQPAAVGTPIITLADTGVWIVETENLNELMVVNVQEGRAVTVGFDAIPDLKLAGRVERVAVRAEDKRGEVTYTARVRLENTDPRLRWGMTALVVLK